MPTVTRLLLAIVPRPQQVALIWRLLKHARKRGYLTRDELDRMGGPELPSDRMEALKRELWKLHISILVTGDKR